MNVTYRGSPNFAPRKGGIDRIVVHWFGSGTLESADGRFQNKDSKVSAHYAVSKGRVWQWVFEKSAAWHAGNLAMNDRSIGIEHDATLNNHDLSETDYRLSAELIAGISKRWDIPLDRTHVIQHKEVKPTQCPGTVDLDKLIALAKEFNTPTPMRPLKVQLIFNNQKYGTELSMCVEANQRMRFLTDDKVDLEFVNPIYSTFLNPPTELNGESPDGQTYRAVARDWFLLNLFTQAPTADVIIFVGPQGDWNNIQGNMSTYGLYYPTLPMTFPALIQLVAGETDKSWKWPNQSAFVNYVVHEIAHSLFQAAEVPDRTHELDYGSIDGLHSALPGLDYSLIARKLALRTNYMTEFPVFKRDNDGTLYACVGGFYLLPIAATWEKFVADFPGAKVVTLTPNELLKYRIGGKTLVKDR